MLPPRVGATIDPATSGGCRYFHVEAADASDGNLGQTGQGFRISRRPVDRSPRMVDHFISGLEHAEAKSRKSHSPSNEKRSIQGR